MAPTSSSSSAMTSKIDEKKLALNHNKVLKSSKLKKIMKPCDIFKAVIQCLKLCKKKNSDDDNSDSDNDDDDNWHARIKINKNLGWKIKNEIYHPGAFENTLEYEKSDWKIFYTDASWSEHDDYMGLAWVSDGLGCNKYQVTSDWTSSQGEAMIINMVLEYISNENIKKSIICSDSLSSLESFNNLEYNYYADELIHDMQRWIDKICENGQEIELWWCPAHMGIDGNEHADSAAQCARHIGKHIIYKKTAGNLDLFVDVRL
ncbi:uncharacterized protein LOC122850057 isoform X1 [Aphidius gifuensis]|uniref:uncharacterized protein LOC122850057 isoform X1 n=1 Tax=Aphidius gifuensis TaxID=684658 RepID=UPI001CDCB63A|nr:uncharacterized protein LOC122850057 isoform X1 [Aphidius gifuensis]XP_044004979.1 uncharacterized protein LOC122850057 isoform X1 [Aphidius gifuensis]